MFLVMVSCHFLLFPKHNLQFHIPCIISTISVNINKERDQLTLLLVNNVFNLFFMEMFLCFLGQLKTEASVFIPNSQENISVHTIACEEIPPLPHQNNNAGTSDIVGQDNYLPQNSFKQYCCQGCKDNG